LFYEGKEADMPRRIITTVPRKIDLDEWYTNDEAVKRLSENAGRPIDKNYPRTLARYGKVDVLDIGTGAKLYRRRDIDNYVVQSRPGRKADQGKGKGKKEESAA
jgi:hypothetical protein